MKAQCPQCGAEVEFRYDDSFVRVCSFCRAAVVRGDRGIESLGRVADLAPIESPLTLFGEGRWRGQSFMLLGRAQFQHPAGGLWQEWYAKFSDGRWGWIAEAQGQYYLTFESAGAGEVPSWQALGPGSQVVLQDGGPRAYVVGERAQAVYFAAEGEIPYRFMPGGSFFYADLSDGAGRFGTIDYGGSHDPDFGNPAVYLGQQVTLADLGLVAAGGPGPEPEARIAARHLACPQCGGAIELRAPDATQRIACPFCDALLDAGQGDLVLLGRLGKARGKPPIPLGTKGEFEGAEFVLIGYVRRIAFDDGRWPFDEYLLYNPKLGFRWLVESDGHWSYARPVPPGAAEADYIGDARYEGVRFRRFSYCPVQVAAVFGEFYWKVQVGETVHATDWIAPPAMLSKEEGADEVNWTLSEYLPSAEVARRLGLAEMPVAPVGVGANQPFRHHRVASYFGYLLLGTIAAAIVVGIAVDERVIAEQTFMVDDPANRPAPAEATPGTTLGATPGEVTPGTTLGATPGTTPETPPAPVPPGPQGQVFFSEPFELSGTKNVEIRFRSDVNNGWLFIGGDLVNETTGEVESFEKPVEYYSGYTDGESWTEGSPTSSLNMGSLDGGRYVLRLEVMRSPSTGGISPPLRLDTQVRQGVFRYGHMGLLVLAVGIPGLLLLLGQFLFERRRWRHSDYAPRLLRSSGDDE